MPTTNEQVQVSLSMERPETCTWASGITIRRMGRENTPGKMGMFMRGNGVMIRCMGLGSMCMLIREMFILDLGLKIRDRDKEPICIKMEPNMSDKIGKT